MPQQQSSRAGEAAADRRSDDKQHITAWPEIQKYHDEATGEDVETMISSDETGQEASRRTTRVRIDSKTGLRHCLVVWQKDGREVRRREDAHTTLDPTNNYYEGLTSCSADGRLIWVNQSTFDPNFEGDPDRSRATFKRWAADEGSTYEVKTKKTDPETLSSRYSVQRQTVDFKTGRWRLESTDGEFDMAGQQVDRTIWEIDPDTGQLNGLTTREVNGEEVWRRNLTTDRPGPPRD